MKKIFTLILAVAFALAACGGGAAAPLDVGGKIDVNAGLKSAGSVKIAVAAPLSGPYAQGGMEMHNAAMLMARQWNDAGGVRIGDSLYTVEIVAYDDRADVETAMSVAAHIVSDPDIVGVVGHYLSAPSLVASHFYEESQYVAITPSASYAEYTDTGGYIFRNSTITAREAAVLADMTVNDLGAASIGLLTFRDEWSVAAGDAFEAGVAAVGGNLVLREQIPYGQMDYSAEIARFQAAGCDAVFVAGMSEALALFAVAGRNSGLDAPIISFSNGYFDSLLEIAGDAANGIYLPVTFFAGSSDPAVQAFVAAYTGEYGEAPSVHAAQVYDSVGILLEAVQRAGSLDRAAIRNEVHNTAYNGVSGYTTFDSTGDSLKQLTILQVVDGEFRQAVF